MAWADYWQDQIDAVDATEEQTERAWERALLALLLWERWMRRRVVRGAMDLPVVRGGFLDTRDRAAMTRFRAQVYRDAERATREARRALGVGVTRREMRLITERRTLPEGFVRDELDAVIDRIPPAAPLPADVPSGPGAKPITPRPGRGARGAVPAAVAEDATPVVAPKTLTPAMLKEIEQELGKLPPTGGALEDRWDVGYDAIANIARNLGYEFRRVTETVVGRLTGRANRREDIIAYMDGGERGKPWTMNRNNMRLSTTAHIRAAHRRRNVSEGVAKGITHYRLDVPSSRLRSLGRSGLMGRYIWQVKPLSEWNRISTRLNARRVAASSFDTLGLHHNDFSYVVPVPAVYMRAATRQGRKLRGRFLAGAILTMAAMRREAD